MTEPPNQLPPGLGGSLGDEPSNSDEIRDLKNRLELAEDALEDIRLVNDVLESEVKLLREELPIKQSAFRFARAYLILIPVIALMLVLLSANDGLAVTGFGKAFSFDWKVKLEGYTQSALVIGPIIFVATVLGFLVKAVFANKPTVESSIDPSVIQMVSSLLGGRN